MDGDGGGDEEAILNLAECRGQLATHQNTTIWGIPPAKLPDHGTSDSVPPPGRPIILHNFPCPRILTLVPV